MTEKSYGKRALLPAAAAFAAFTAAWILVCFANTGDAFPQGPAAQLLPVLGLSPVVVAWLLRRTDSKLARILVAAATLLAVAFWLLVSDGWWAAELPPLP